MKIKEQLLELTYKLKEEGIEFRVIELSDRAITVEDVVKFSKGDIKKDEICKTIIIKTEKGNYFGLFLEGNKKIDFDKIKKLLNAKARIASQEEVEEIAGVEPGAVCPLLLKIPLIVDKEILKLRKVNFGSGNHLFGIEMSPNDIVNLTNAQLEDMSTK